MITYETLKNVFAEILDEHKIPCQWHSFIQLPKDHCFGTYCIAETEFDGADEMCFYRHDTVNLCLFYKDTKTDNDNSLETEIEDELKPVGAFSKKYLFDSANGLFYTVYTVVCNELI